MGPAKNKAKPISQGARKSNPQVLSLRAHDVASRRITLAYRPGGDPLGR